ncbi:MAG: cysteine desulfurase [Patescibacteria group bacterium]|nr:cysteine desulfurase [Patescibacteria group bacterium]
MFWKKRVYLDHASSTPVDPRVARAVLRAMAEFPGNPSAPHEEGRRASGALFASRVSIARSLSIKPEELVFTSGGTEANNIAIRGLVEGLRTRGAAYAGLHIVSTAIEHSSVMKTLAALEREGVSVTYVGPGADGIVRAEDVVRAIRPETALVTLAHVNSELGTVQPIAEIATMIYHSARKRGASDAADVRDATSALSRFAPECRFPVIHADAAQSPLYLDASPHFLKADLVSYDAQKMRGPKGVGVLYRDFSVPLAPLYGGGTQERSLRPGTENVPAIVGAALAFTLAKEGRAARTAAVAAVRDFLVERIEAEIPAAKLIGHRTRRIANNAHFIIPGVSGDYLAVLMDKEGVAVTPRSACVGSGEAFSHVVLAVTHDKDEAKETIRFSLGPETSRRDALRAVAALKKSIAVAVPR